MFIAKPCHFPSDGLTGWIFGGKGGKEVAVENPNLQITRAESTLAPTDSTGDLSQEDVSLNLQLIQEKVNNVVSYISIFIQTLTPFQKHLPYKKMRQIFGDHFVTIICCLLQRHCCRLV